MNAKQLLVSLIVLLALICLGAATGAQALSLSPPHDNYRAAAPLSSLSPRQALDFDVAASAPLTTPTPFATFTPTNTAAPPTLTLTPCPMNFSDVHPGDPFYDDIRYLYCQGSVSGYADGTFRPGNWVIVGQAVKMLVLAFHVPIYVPPSFCGIPPTDPFYMYITSWYHYYAPLFDCTGLNLYRNMLRSQLAKVLVTTACWPIDTHGGPHFSDVTPSDYFYTQVETAYNHGVISGYADGTFRPYNTITRGQISKMAHLGALQAQCTMTPVPTVVR